MKNRILVMIASVVLLALATTIRAAEVTVFAASSLAEPLKDIAAYYEFKSGDRIVLSFETSGTLAKQIEAGTPADVFFSADEACLDGLAKQSLIDTNTRQSLLGNILVVVVATNSLLTITAPNDLTNAAIKRIAVADPRTTSAGKYVQKWLDNFHLVPAIELKAVAMENTSAVLAAVEAGDAEIGVVYKTEALLDFQVSIAYEVPLKDGPDISYPLAVVKAAREPEAAKNFIQYLNSDAATKIFLKRGFLIRQ